ncbi:MAG: DUF1697 domain-containing protein [Acidobacteria bacterium]|nr:DUF1697 domain-containing protein [Acidobacteriota bacterium]
MPAIVSLLTAVNVGGRQIQKDSLIAIHKSAGCLAPQTLLTSGNVVFETRQTNLVKLAAAIETEVEKQAGFQSFAILRTQAELEATLATNPFPNEDAAKNLISFLKSEPSPQQIAAALAIDVAPERMEIRGREMFLYFPNGQGRSKFPTSKITKALGAIPATGRNRNTVEKLIAMLAVRNAG